MILACHGINKAFGEEIIVKDGSFHIEDHEKAALVGPNGAGKSTIFKIIAGELPSDGGSVILTKGKTMGYLAQHQDMNTDRSIYEEVRTAKADIIAMEQKIRQLELEMKDLSGDSLEDHMDSYNRLTAAFEREKRTDWRLKGTRFSGRRIYQTGEYALRRTENPCFSRQTSAY